MGRIGHVQAVCPSIPEDQTGRVDRDGRIRATGQPVGFEERRLDRLAVLRRDRQNRGRLPENLERRSVR